MDILNNGADFIVYLASHCGYLGIFLLNMLEFACLPFPSEIVLPAIGAGIASGKYSFICVLPLSLLGGIFGCLISYSVGSFAWGKIGNSVISKSKKFRVVFDKIEKLFNRYGKITVFLARVLPFTRTYVSLFAGAEKVNKSIFIIFSASGIILLDFFYLSLGYLAYDNKEIIERVLRRYSIFMIIIILVVLIIYFLYKHHKNKNLKLSS